MLAVVVTAVRAPAPLPPGVGVVDLVATGPGLAWRDTTRPVAGGTRELEQADAADPAASKASPVGAASAASAAMERYAAGDEAAFVLVYDALAPRLHAFVLRRTQGDGARADDLVQQTFLQMHHARGRFLAGADVVPWAYAIARRLLIDSVRRGAREVVTDDGQILDGVSASAGADDLLVAKQTAEIIEAELERLPPAQREAFDLVKTEGLSMAEAAEALGTTVTAVKLRAHRAYEALRGVLGGGGTRKSAKGEGE